MIQKFRYRFIAISTTALLIVILTIIGSIYGLTYYNARQEVNNVLTILVKNDGQIPRVSQAKNYAQQQFSREGLHQYRYFTVNFDRADQVVDVDTSHITNVSPGDAQKITQRIARRHRLTGQLMYQGNAYAYKARQGKKGTNVVVLDESLIMSRITDLMHTGLMLGSAILLLFTLVLVLYSRHAIQPLIQAEQRQKRFITNASHELKTPLTVISANNDMQELTGGENEWTTSTRQQVERLTKLINNLVSLARMQEQETMTLVPVDVSRIANSVAENFTSVVKTTDKLLQVQVVPHLVVDGDKDHLRELFNILLDNANKYCDPQGTVRLTVRPTKRRRNVVITIGNTYRKGATKDYRRFFERFYRADVAHTQNENSKGGFVIVLSMAQYIVKAMHGKITAEYRKPELAFVIVLRAVEKAG